MADEDIRVRASLRDELSRPLRKIQREVTQTALATRRLNKVAGGDLTRALSRSEAGMAVLHRAAGRAHTGLLSLSAGAGRAATAVGVGLVAAASAGAAALGVFGVKTASNLENANVALESILGSAEQARGVFELLKRLDLEVPFDLGQMQQASVALLAIGTPVADLEQQLRGIADVAAGTADPQQSISRITRAITQMRSLGRVSAEELNQLTDAGVGVAKYIPLAFGMSMQEARAAMERGEDFDPELLINALFGGTAGFAERAQKTLTGMFSSLKSAVQVELADTASPLMAALKDAMPSIQSGIVGVLQSVGPPLIKLATVLLDLVMRALPVVAPLLGALADGIAQLVTAAGPAFAALEPVIADLSAAGGELVAALVEAMPDLVDLFVALVGVLPDFVRLLADLVPLVVPIAQLATALLSYEPLAPMFAGLLAGLLAYRALAGIIGILYAFAGGLTAVGAAGTVAGVGAGGAAGAAGLLGRARGLIGPAALGIAGGAMAVQGQSGGKNNALQTIGGTALTGAALGSVIPGVGTLVGGLGGAAIGAGWSGARALFGGDKPKAQPGNTGAGYDAAAAAAIAAAQQEAAALSVTMAPGSVVVYPQTELDLELGLSRGLERVERNRRERG